MSSSRRPTSSSVSGLDTFGIRIASGAGCSAADKSSACQGVSVALMRMKTSRWPKPPAFTASATCLRAVSLASGATESSRSRMTPSAASVLAFSKARALEPGMYSTLRRGWIMPATLSAGPRGSRCRARQLRIEDLVELEAVAVGDELQARGIGIGRLVLGEQDIEVIELGPVKPEP